jgi:curved DNA-binding protein CbpA
MHVLDDINTSDKKSEKTSTTARRLTHYDILNVSREASMEEIKASFRRLALEKHPDKNPERYSSIMDEDFRRLQQAWECLRDSRQSYDQELRRADDFLKAKVDSAIRLKLSDMEEAVDEETDKTLYLFTCRCGEDIEVWHDALPKFDHSVFLRECPGCSFTYAIEC